MCFARLCECHRQQADFAGANEFCLRRERREISDGWARIGIGVVPILSLVFSPIFSKRRDFGLTSRGMEEFFWSVLSLA
jgi:hypothetical protein